MKMAQWMKMGVLLAAIGGCAGAKDGVRPKHASGDDYQYGAYGTYRTMDDAQAEEEAREAKTKQQDGRD